MSNVSCDFPYLLQAQNDELITMEASYDNDTVKWIVTQLYSVFTGNEDTTEGVEWNKWRQEMLTIAVEKYLLNDLKKETLLKLEADAKEFVSQKCAQNLRARLRMGKYRAPPDDIIKGEILDEWPEMQIIMGVCHSTEKAKFRGEKDQPSVLVVLDEHQEYKDSMQLGHSRKTESYRKGLEAFVKKHMPHVIAVGTSDPGAMELFQDLRSIAEDLKANQYLPEGLRQMRVLFLHDEIPRIYSKSERAMKELKSQKQLLCQAVSLARYLADPLTELANLALNPDDLTCLYMHPLQKALDQTLLVQRLHREVIDTVNACAVDLNCDVVLSTSWLAWVTARRKPCVLP